MAHENIKSQWISHFIGIAILVATTMDLAFCQIIASDDGLSSVKYEAKLLYNVTLSIDPYAVQFIADPRFSSAFYPKYEMVYMTKGRGSQIRKLSELMDYLNTPTLWPAQTDIVTDHTTIPNPNKVGVLPSNTVSHQPSYVWWVASGSYSDTSLGGIYLINMSSERWRPIPIVNEVRKEYRHTEWVDMNNDGYVDCVTIEGSKSTNSLVWLKQPSEQTSWVKHSISNVTDDVGGTEFRLMKLVSKNTGKMTNVFIVAGMTTGKLTAYWVEDADDDWTRVKKIKSSVIAADGFYVGLEIVDLNADGRLEILTSTSATILGRGMVIAYEYPRGGINSGGKWRKHLLHQWTRSNTGYAPTSPGPVFSFVLNTQRKPHILVSGKDDGSVYIMSPKTWSPYIWDYTLTEIWNSSKSIGTPAVADVDGDGNFEIFLPSDFVINVLSYGKYSEPKEPVSPKLFAIREDFLNFVAILNNFAKKIMSTFFKPA